MPLQEHSESCVTDGVASGRRDIWSGMFAAINVAHGHRIVSRPGIVHADREAEVIACLRRRMGPIDSDGADGALIPNAGDAIGSRRLDIDAGSANKQWNE